MHDVDIFLRTVEKSRGIVFFGVGNRYRYIERVYQQTIMEDKLLFCIDNNPELQGTNIMFGTKSVPIYSIEFLKKINYDNVLVVITCARPYDIIAQLLYDEELKSLEYICFQYFCAGMLEEEAMKREIPQSLCLSEKQLIPKTIHYCWFGKKPIPDKNKKWMESWSKYCPDYEIVLWNEDNYDITKNAYMLEAYKNGKWGFVPDYARLDIIYNYGGIYLDTDVELINNLDDLLYQSGFAGFESNDYVALGLGFGAKQGLPIIKEFRDMYDDVHFINVKGEMNLTASPVYQTRLLEGKGLLKNGEFQIIDDLTIYPEKMFSGKSSSTLRIRLNTYTKSIHHYDGSWLDGQSKEWNLRYEKEIQSFLHTSLI